MTLPLDGTRVLDLGISTAGPYAARFLADLGAEVIKVEPIDGENSRKLGLRFGGTGYLFHVNNYNKKSFALNVQSAEGRSIFLDLVAKSDLVIENFALGTMDRWGIGYEACRSANPSIIYCSVKGFGMDGPLADKRAFDTVVQAMSGIMGATGYETDPPLKAGPSECDLMTAVATAMAAISSILDRKPGQSQFVDTSLFDMGVWSLLPLWPLAETPCGPLSSSFGNSDPRHAPYGKYDCKDGPLFVTVTSNEDWTGLAQALDLPSGWNAMQRVDNRAFIDAKLAVWVAERLAWDAAKELQDMAVPAAPVLTVGESITGPETAPTTAPVEVDHPVFGHIPLLRSPMVAREKTGIRNLQPMLGADTDSILTGLLGRPGEIETLRNAGVIR